MLTAANIAHFILPVAINPLNIGGVIHGILGIITGGTNPEDIAK